MMIRKEGRIRAPVRPLSQPDANGMTALKVMSAGAVEGPVRELMPAFMRDSGHEVELSVNTVGALRDRFIGGEAADVIILSVPAIEALEKAARLAAAPISAAPPAASRCAMAC